MGNKRLLVIFFVFCSSLYAGIGVGESATGSLPVELASFSATINEGVVILNWITATEVDNYGFELERAASGDLNNNISEELKWEVLGFIEGHGNSNSPKEYTFIDENPFYGIIQYRLKQIDTDGKFAYSEIITVEMHNNSAIPKDYALYQNYPNPFNPSTTISYSIQTSSNVKLVIYDILGNLVKILVNEAQREGNYSLIFNAQNLCSGVYLYKLSAISLDNDHKSFLEVKRMLLIK